MSPIAAEIDQFVEMITPELEHQLDEVIAGLPPDIRAAATRCRRRLLRQLIEFTRTANLKHRLAELEAASRPQGEALH